MITLDGRKITKEIEEKLKKIAEEKNVHPSLAIFYIGSHPAIEQFIRMKERFGKAVGAIVTVYHFPETEDQETILHTLNRAKEKNDGMIVQLPVPAKFNAEVFTEAIPPEKDVDVLGKATFEAFSKGETVFLPGVVGAIDELAKAYNITFSDKKISIIGKGRLVGVPVFTWLKQKGVEARVLDKESNLSEELKDADIIISGVGVPYIIKKEMIKEGVVIFDAGTSEEGGVVAGDADPQLIEKAAYLSPVPGGIGPLTVATLFQNLFRVKHLL